MSRSVQDNDARVIFSNGLIIASRNSYSLEIIVECIVADGGYYYHSEKPYLKKSARYQSRDVA